MMLTANGCLPPAAQTAVTRNVSEKSISNILDYVGGEGKHAAEAPAIGIDALEAYYGATMEVLAAQKNERLSVKCDLKLARLWLDRREYARLRPVCGGDARGGRATEGRG